MRDYKRYDVWVKSHELVLIIYKEVIPVMPKSEQYELTSQLKRAAYSVPMNISEGSGRNSDKDFTHFLDMALGSTNELEYCFFLARELNFIVEDLYLSVNGKINEVKAKLINLIKSIR